MGYSLRTDVYRYTEWATWNGTSLRPEWGSLVGVELYSHPSGNDSTCDGRMNSCFDNYENVNLAHDLPAVVAQLSTKLHTIVAAQWES